MPLNTQFHTPTGGELSLWKITENPDILLETLTMTDAAKREWSLISHPKRQREWLAARHLFHELQIFNNIYYLPNGKPALNDGRRISISHSHDLVGVLINSDKDVGLDIQAPDEKLITISSKFCNEDEIHFALNSTHPLETFTILWSAKEAVFKVYGQNIHFSQQMNVKPFHLSDDFITLDFRSEDLSDQTFRLPLLKVDKYFILMAEK